ncbi:MAG: hypothetical protein ACQEWR_21145 [Bacillota bacterium]
MTIKLSNLPDEVKVIHEDGFPTYTVGEIKENIKDYGLQYHDDTYFLLLDNNNPDDMFGDEIDIDVFPDHFEGFIAFSRSELAAIKDNIIFTEMNGHDLNKIEKGILAKVEAAMYPQDEVVE